MGLVDDLKNTFKGLKLIEIKTQLAEKLNVTVNLFGIHYHAPLPPGADPMRIGSTEVTPQMQKQYQEKVESSLTAKGNVIASLPPEEATKTALEIAVHDAVYVLDQVTVSKEEVIVSKENYKDDS